MRHQPCILFRLSFSDNICVKFDGNKREDTKDPSVVEVNAAQCSTVYKGISVRWLSQLPLHLSV